MGDRVVGLRIVSGAALSFPAVHVRTFSLHTHTFPRHTRTHTHILHAHTCTHTHRVWGISVNLTELQRDCEKCENLRDRTWQFLAAGQLSPGKDLSLPIQD